MIESENPWHSTGAQVKQLRSMAHHLNPAIIIGKSDINEGTVEQTVAYLEKHELVGAPVLDGSSSRGVAEELADRCHAEVVRYRPQVLAVSRVRARISRRLSSSKSHHPVNQHTSSQGASEQFGRSFFIARRATALSLPSLPNARTDAASRARTPLTCPSG